MAERRAGPSLTLVVLAVFAVALAARAVPLYWSPLPATLDGFRYARLAEQTLATGGLPLGLMDADEFVFTLGLVAASALTGVEPLSIAQPFVVTAGAALPTVAAALAHRLAVERGWRGRDAALAALLTGTALALDGIIVRRTGVPDEEALGLLLVPILAIAAHRWLSSGRHAWGVSTVAVLVVLPPLHNLSALMGVLTVWGLVCLHATVAATRAKLARVAVLGVGAWVVFMGYFELAARTGLVITYSGLLRPYLGLFVAWVVVIGIAAVWTRGATTRTKRAVVGAPILLCLLLIALNAFTPLFPGTVLSPTLVVAMLFGFTLPVGLAVVGAPVLGRSSGLVSLAGYLAPLGFIFYAFTASLTAPFFGAVLRTQSFGHVAVLAVGGIGVVGIGRWLQSHDIPFRRGLYVLAVAIFLTGILVTLPLAYLNLDTGTYPSTTLESEFEASAFATERVDGAFATDHSLSRVVGHYHTPLGPPVPGGPTGEAAVNPTRTWLRGGPPPTCPVLSQHSWATTGAHLYPTPPASIDTEAYRDFLATRNLVYDAGGRDPVVLTRPVGQTDGVCRA